MVLNITEEILRERFANVQNPAMGEKSLLEKLMPVICIRERQLHSKMLPMSMFTLEELEPLCVDVVAYGALYDGLPMLDVLLTQNGLATVGNNTMSPASAARSKEARNALESLLFQSQEALLLQLRQNKEWLDSKWASIFRRSLIVSLSDLCALNPDRSSDCYDLAMVMQLKAAIEEDRLAQRYISPELMDHLRRGNLACSLSPDEEHVVRRIQEAVTMKIESKGMSGEILIDVVEYIKQRPSAFPLWHKSRVAQTFVDHRFTNTQKSSGFFF